MEKNVQRQFCDIPLPKEANSELEALWSLPGLV